MYLFFQRTCLYPAICEGNIVEPSFQIKKSNISCICYTARSWCNVSLRNGIFSKKLVKILQSTINTTSSLFKNSKEKLHQH